MHVMYARLAYSHELRQQAHAVSTLVPVSKTASHQVKLPARC